MLAPATRGMRGIIERHAGPHSGKDSLAGQLIFRFLVGGLLVAAFSSLGDVFKPRGFAGLFGAAPSVALSTLTLTIATNGKSYAAIEAHSMIAGAVAFFIYAFCAVQILFRRKPSAVVVTSVLLTVWLAVAFSLWFVWLR
jgi:hypothetical protein